MKKENTLTQVINENDSLLYIGEVWKKHSKLVKDFISALMEFSPEKRLTAKEALEHEWIKKSATMEDVDTAVTAEAFKNLSKFRVRFSNIDHQNNSQSKNYNRQPLLLLSVSYLINKIRKHSKNLSASLIRTQMENCQNRK